ncbi:response regulator transcription factor [Paenibacillus flagellatus]|uniref:DNA-binding response regulator n=1 Tax=Paenibacillus flagellatus TaxID=2211139 RepID=A0A2V5KCF2_9BACL|nr:response regulator [Paenibacillus flagellatus]PYI57285.1 hypothetical protein DLM86_02250 [Paenibacillus flagellatus]
MNVLIVDDEDHVREGITLAVDWAKFGVDRLLYAENGEQALALAVEHRPAVIFCDMSMPGMDGAELLQRLRRHDPSAQLIVVSGYDHFSYTHAALLAKGIDYLLKPFRTSDLEQALGRAVAEWKRHMSQFEKQIEDGDKLRRADALMDEQKLAGYFKGEIVFNEDIRRLFARRGLPLERLEAALYLPINRSELLHDRFRGDTELLAFSLNNIAHDILNRYGAHYLCRLDEHQWLLLTVPEDPNGAGRHRYHAEKVAAAWRETLGLHALLGRHEGHVAADRLDDAIAGARSDLLRHDVLHGDTRPAGSPSTDKLPRLTDQQLVLETALKRKDKALAGRAIRSFTGQLRALGSLRLKELQGFTHEANLLLEKMSRTPQAETKLANRTMPLWIGHFDEWERVLIGLWETLIDESGEETPDRSVEAIRDYIADHYQDDLSLTTLAAVFNFNPWYISRRFKELYGTTVITYLTELRIDKAKSLLTQTNMSVSEMAGKLGYADENYFGKVFKKQTGLSPLQFRKERRDG